MHLNFKKFQYKIYTGILVKSISIYTIPFMETITYHIGIDYYNRFTYDIQKDNINIENEG
jgi:hypothetical protein